MTHFDYYRRAKTHEKQGDYQKAIADYAKAIEISTDYAHAWFYKGKLHYRLGQFRECMECAQKALELAPDWADHCTKMLSDARAKSGLSS